MLFLELIAERKIAEAVSRGELDDLPGSGRPLELEDDALVPEELRLAAQAKAAKRLALLRTRFEAAYYDKLVKRFSR